MMFKTLCAESDLKEQKVKGDTMQKKKQKLVRKTAANHLGVMLDDDQNWLCRKRFG